MAPSRPGLWLVAALGLACGDDSSGETSLSGADATSPTTASTTGTTSTSTGTSESTGEEPTGTTTGGPLECTCAPGTDLIYVLSHDAELWSYDPAGDAFEMITAFNCGGDTETFSMAVDRNGQAWVLFIESEDIFTVDINDPTGCEDPNYEPGQGGFGLFGMSFVSNSLADPCEKMFLHSYNGFGPFSEGDNVGSLGVLDPLTVEVTSVGFIDYNGGELAGTGEGRLFAFAGAPNAKIIEYDKETAAELDVLTLTGFSKTAASAFAFWGGDAYLFTDAHPPDCLPCLEQQCPASLDTCLMNPLCAIELDCVMETGEVTDACGGGINQLLQDCLAGVCFDACFPNQNDRISKVTRLDHDDSEGQGQVLTEVNPAAPIRIVGAGTSTCAPYNPP